MKAQVFSVEFIIYLLISIYLLRIMLNYINDLRENIFLIERTPSTKFLGDKAIKEITQRAFVMPGVINSSKLNLDIPYANIRVFFQNGSTISRENINCSDEIWFKRIFLDEKDDIVVIEVGICED